MQTLHFCTYCDENYAVRALVMLDSMRTARGRIVLHVLALSSAAELIFGKLRDPRIVVHSLGDLEEWDRELAARRTTRSWIEYIFTLSPCLPRYIFSKYPELESVTYLDSDLFFTSAVDLVQDCVGEASVAVIPHRFAPGSGRESRFGRFNVGWIGFRNDGTGRECLDDWRGRCLDWCRDAEEPGRFADQMYLDPWPEKFGAHIIGHPGANLALWNAAGARLQADAGCRLTVDSHPLLFYHCHGLVFRDDGFAAIPFKEYGIPVGTRRLLARCIYRPYLGLLFAKKSLISNLSGLDLSIGSKRYLGQAAPGVEWSLRGAWRQFLAWWRPRRSWLLESSLVRIPR
jgi:hypothetical protein